MEVIKIDNSAAEPLEVDPAARVCGNCTHCQESKGGRQCRRFPPQLMYLPIGSPGLTVGLPNVQWLRNASYPPVDLTTPACGEFAIRAEVAN